MTNHTAPHAPKFARFHRGLPGVVLLVNDDTQRELSCRDMEEAEWFAEELNDCSPLTWTTDDLGTIWGDDKS
jgi:hypothetical protein